MVVLPNVYSFPERKILDNQRVTYDNDRKIKSIYKLVERRIL